MSRKRLIIFSRFKRSESSESLAKGISDRSALDAASKSSLFKSVLIASFVRTI